MYLSTETGAALLTETSGLQLLQEGPMPPLQTLSLPMYLYQEYSDDANLQAFITAYNTIANGYLGWFSSTPLGVYTNPNISGPLLDWVMNGIYGIARPVFSSIMFQTFAGINSLPINANEINGVLSTSSGSATLATDDFYKRVGTWILYLGNGRQFNFEWLRLRIARFLFGVNGTDVTLSQAQAVSITGSGAGITITIPPSTAATYFSQAIGSGVLPFPFMLTPTVVIT